MAARVESHDANAEAVRADPDLRLPGDERVRLADLAVRVRLTAYETLWRDGGQAVSWLAEYELLTAWYASRAALHLNYQPRWDIAALVAAWVAARRLVRRQPAEIELGHRRRYAEARLLARSADRADMEGGAASLAALAAEFPHVLELQEELARAYIKLENFREAERILAAVADRYSYTTAETPSLLGSHWKRRAVAQRPPNVAALEESLKWYARAADQHPDDPYPRINSAAVSLMLGKQSVARREAGRVLKILDRLGRRDF